MNIQEAQKQILINAEAGNASICVSGSGMGKSQMGYQAFLQWRASQPKLNCGYGQIFLATQTPPDLIGYQFKGEKTFQYPDGTQRTITVTEPSVPLWMISDEGKPATMYDKFWLTLDEYGQGDPDTKRSSAEILLNGGTAPWYLPLGSVRVAMSNVGSRYGVTKDFDFCVSRRTLIPIEGNVDITVAHLDKPYSYQGREWQTMAFTKAWALRHPEIVFEKEPVEQGPWCNPRALCAVDRYMQVAASFHNGKLPDDPVTMQMVVGTMGMPAAQSYMGDLKFLQELPQYDEVIADPEGCRVPKKADLLLLMAYELAGRAQSAHVPELVTYVDRFPKDMAVTFVAAVLKRDYKGIILQPEMQKWIHKNATLLAMVNQLT